jgi:hypothetical protein
MDNRLAQLISDYQESVRAALQLIDESGIPVPPTSGDWAATDIPSFGELKGGIPYWKHGIGCKVSFPTGTVDFDFGEKGEVDGFDLWRLSQFFKSSKKDYGLCTEDALKMSFDAAVNEGSLNYWGSELYYVIDATRLRSKGALRIPNGESLPHRDRDAVLTLYAHHFLSADLMRCHYQKADRQRNSDGGFSQNNFVKFRVYLVTWLGYLRSTVEGFEKLGMWMLLSERRPLTFRELVAKWIDLECLKKLHGYDLKALRNDIFHLRDDNSSLERFFADEGERLAWANELHTSMEAFFSTYRVLCEVHYVTHSRYAESEIRRASALRRERSRRK